MTQTFELNPHTLTITAPDGSVIQCRDLMDLMQRHAALEVAARPSNPSNRKETRRSERRSAGRRV